MALKYSLLDNLKILILPPPLVLHTAMTNNVHDSEGIYSLREYPSSPQ